MAIFLSKKIPHPGEIDLDKTGDRPDKQSQFLFKHFKKATNSFLKEVFTAKPYFLPSSNKLMVMLSCSILIL